MDEITLKKQPLAYEASETVILSLVDVDGTEPSVYAVAPSVVVFSFPFWTLEVIARSSNKDGSKRQARPAR